MVHVWPNLKQMTAFVALLTMDANRQKAGRIDWCCCFKSQQFVEEEVIFNISAVVFRRKELPSIVYGSSCVFLLLTAQRKDDGAKARTAESSNGWGCSFRAKRYAANLARLRNYYRLVICQVLLRVYIFLGLRHKCSFASCRRILSKSFFG